MTRYVALLRGINVGGRNRIPMAALKACFEGLGLRGVATYIQSGNVLFEAARGRPALLARRIEDALLATFGHRPDVHLRTLDEMRAIVRGAPRGFGTKPAVYRYDVIYLKASLPPETALAAVPVREGVDAAHAGPGVLYYSRLVRRAAESRLPRLVSMPIYKDMTIRNWNTTTTLLAMLER